jgi:PhoPQ-activated pathogenicity-related protein
MASMMKRSTMLLLVFSALCAAQNTALDRYIKAEDASYKYELVKTVPGSGYTFYVLEMTSQKWRKPSEVDRTEWKHWLTITRPAKVVSDIGLLYIGGGNNGNKAPERPDAMGMNFALATNTVVAQLSMVPNQPLTFAGETKKRTEDGIIAYSWSKFLNGGDEEWPLRLPMTKAAVRAMDTITDFSAKPEGGSVKVNKFVVAGASKRGWTTWITAAADKRVVAIAPLVIDVLNVPASFDHHWRAYGFWAPSIKDYVEEGIMDWMDTPQMATLNRIEDPYSYLDRLTMPKMIICAAGDQFFLPDSWQFYYRDLKGEKNIRYVANTDHSLRNSDASLTLGAFYDAVVNNRPRPKYVWKAEGNTIRVASIDAPSEVKLWKATNPDARDFRLESIGPAYKSTELTDVGSGVHVYVAKIPKPEKGWTAAFIELTYPNGGKFPLKVSTGVKVFPDVYPFGKYVPKKIN